jgi:hypothetical protein
METTKQAKLRENEGFVPTRPTAHGANVELDLLPKVISERPSLREPSARRDEGADKHPQPKSNAAIGFRRPELETHSREAPSGIKKPILFVSERTFGKRSQLDSLKFRQFRSFRCYHL